MDRRGQSANRASLRSGRPGCGTYIGAEVGETEADLEAWGCSCGVFRRQYGQACVSEKPLWLQCGKWVEKGVRLVQENHQVVTILLDDE